MLAKKYSIKTEIATGPEVTVNVKVKLALEERSKLGDLVRKGMATEREIEDALRSGFSKEIENEIIAATEFMKSIGCDAFGFEDDMYRRCFHNYSAYESKDTVLSDLKLKCNIKIAIE